jgi:hypothetical protein
MIHGKLVRKRLPSARLFVGCIAIATDNIRLKKEPSSPTI